MDQSSCNLNIRNVNEQIVKKIVKIRQGNKVLFENFVYVNQNSTYKTICWTVILLDTGGLMKDQTQNYDSREQETVIREGLSALKGEQTISAFWDMRQ